ncbi:hypothetical protein ALP12_200246 [Pseudomonas savastanoi pv. phaseolicola]|nr:hypothetical protein ALP12_200246 [Pseudomonas savastanoi pv. phaseolicola]
MFKNFFTFPANWLLVARSGIKFLNQSNLIAIIDLYQKITEFIDDWLRYSKGLEQSFQY